MKKIMNALIIGVIIALFPSLIYADCQSDFNFIAKDFKVTYEYNEGTNDYNVSFYTPDVNRFAYAMITRGLDSSISIDANGGATTIVRNYKNEEYTYKVIAKYDECEGLVVKDSRILLKPYNPYADNPACSGNEEFALCQKDYEGEIDDEIFNTRMEAYIESKENSTPIINNDAKKSNSSTEEIKGFFEEAIDYLTANTSRLITAIIVTLVLIAVITFLVVRAIRKSIRSRRLE